MRSAVAKQNGLDETLVSQLGRTDPDLTAAQIAATDFATAMMSDPGGISDDLSGRLNEHFTTEQITELALDVMKWSYQKFAVALGVDRPIVDGKLTDLVFDDDGNWVRPT